MEEPGKEIIAQSWFPGVGLFSSQFFSTASVALFFWYGRRLLNQGLISSKQLFQAFFILMSTGKTIADAGSMTSDLAKGTIHQNIAYGKEDATESELRNAANLANVHEFISSVKRDMKRTVDKEESNYQGGQKQWVALAQAFLKKPAIFLLDEATSALDSESEKLAQKVLNEMMVGKTCVVVAHRISMIQKSDIIVAIKDGKVAEQGSHSDLLAVRKGGYYYSLLKLHNNHSIDP